MIGEQRDVELVAEASSWEDAAVSSMNEGLTTIAAGRMPAH
jgi:hypothetical protein